MDDYEQRNDAGGAGQVQRAACPFEVTQAGLDAQTGEYRIGGYMNTFGAMHSRRIIHPRGFLKWLAKHRNARLPMLGNHGEGVASYAMIGEWDTFEHHEGRGMYWAGRVGSGTQLADDARRLLDQKLLRQLSFGFVVRQGRWVSLKDADLDPHLRAAMEAAELDEAYAVFDWYPVEGSIVDVADDPGARIAAKLRDEISSLKQQLAGQSPAPSGAASIDLAALRETFDGFLEDFKLAAIEALNTDPDVIQAARDRAESVADFVQRNRAVERAGLQQRLDAAVKGLPA
jgi:HK97 family phage prohead protease